MTDIYSKRVRSAIMARIGSKNTRPELQVRKFLHSRGFRFRLHCCTLPGRPDLVLRKYKIVIFVHGCFWHHHRSCNGGALPTSRIRFWKTKILGNVTRDLAQVAELKRMGWRPLVIWECETEREHDLSSALKSLLRSHRRASP